MNESENQPLCLDAVDAAEKVVDIVASFANYVSKYPPLVSDAFEAGLAGGRSTSEP